MKSSFVSNRIKKINFLFIKNDNKKLKKYPDHLRLGEIRMDLEFVFGNNFDFLNIDNSVIPKEDELKFYLLEIVILIDKEEQLHIVYLKNDDKFKRKKNQITKISGKVLLNTLTLK